jgi:hypothetical protein
VSSCVVIGGPKTGRGVFFDGTNDWLTRSSALTGASANDTGTVSFWARFDVDSHRHYVCQMTKDGVATLSIFREVQPSRQFQINFARTNTSPYVLGDLTSSNEIPNDTWIHILASWDVSAATSTWKLYFDDVEEATGFRDRTGDISWDATTIIIGGSGSMEGDIADFWLDNSFMDLSNSTNRRKFISDGGEPVPLGTTGQLPTGSAPLIFLRGPASGFHRNRSGKGDFSVTGALTNSSSHPP